MNRVLRLTLVLFALLAVVGAGAQTIALSERAPRIKKAKWFNSAKPPKSDFAFVEFVHSASAPCRQSVERICKIVEELPNTSFIIVTHQSAAEVDSWVTDCAKDRVGIIVEDSRIRNSFGVNYAPYAVILDGKRRALWFGNPQRLDRKTIDKIMTADH